VVSLRKKEVTSQIKPDATIVNEDEPVLRPLKTRYKESEGMNLRALEYVEITLVFYKVRFNHRIILSLASSHSVSFSDILHVFESLFQLIQVRLLIC